MSSRVFIEGGGTSKELRRRCCRGFSQLFHRCGFSQRMPSLRACGGRSEAFDAFATAKKYAGGDYVGMLVDSEDPVEDIERTWAHVKRRDGWDRPDGAGDEQVLLMVTCMETWIVVDRDTLKKHYGDHLRESALPALDHMETRDRAAVQEGLTNATRECRNAYAKGKRSFELVGKLNPEALRPLLPSFVRFERVLGERL